MIRLISGFLSIFLIFQWIKRGHWDRDWIVNILLLYLLEWAAKWLKSVTFPPLVYTDSSSHESEDAIDFESVFKHGGGGGEEGRWFQLSNPLAESPLHSGHYDNQTSRRMYLKQRSLMLKSWNKSLKWTLIFILRVSRLEMFVLETFIDQVKKSTAYLKLGWMLNPWNS